MSAIDRHYDAILNIEVNLFEHAGEEDRSAESLLEGFINLTADSGAIPDTPNVREHGTDRKSTRRMIVDRLIQETGGVASLQQLSFESLADPDDDIVTGILTDILLRACRTFTDDPINEKAVQEIEADSVYLARLAQGRFEETHQFIVDQVGKKLGVYPSDE